MLEFLIGVFKFLDVRKVNGIGNVITVIINETLKLTHNPARWHLLVVFCVPSGRIPEAEANVTEVFLVEIIIKRNGVIGIIPPRIVIV
jgi:hypothetical protein